MKDCIIIKGRVKGKKFRPGTPSPDMHWSGMLLSLLEPKDNFAIKWIDGELCVAITKDSFKEDEAKFIHINDFCRMHELDVHIDRNECEHCEGHDSCISRV